MIQKHTPTTHFTMINKIVIDLDDTISFCHDRKWDKATPNLPVIRKINQLYNDGWEVVIFSSRGQLSKVDYFSQVSEWLTNHGVLYTGLMFGKPLASLYVDDKACNTNDFINLDIQNLKGGSGSKVVKIGNQVHKMDKNIEDTLRWYKFYDELFYLPKVLGVTGNQLILQYIKPSRPSTYKDGLSMVDIMKHIHESYNYDISTVNTFGWAHYIGRIERHCELIKVGLDVDLSGILRILTSMLPPIRSISHGDLNPDNIIIDRHDRIVLVDPINVTYSSYMIDLAKLVAWGIINEPDDYKIDGHVHTYKGSVVTGLTIAELIRTIKYSHPDRQKQIIKICSEYLKD